MATPSQISANRENAQHSCGPKTDAGKQASSQNNRRHGLTGHTLFFLDWECPEAFDRLEDALRAEHQPATPTEEILVEKMLQHYWLAQRAQQLQTIEMNIDPSDSAGQMQTTHYLRYQLQHERLFQRALHDLLKLRAERRKEQIGFESQRQAAARETRCESQEVRRQAEETRKTERHQLAISVASTKLERELIHTERIKAAVPPRKEPQKEAEALEAAA